MFAKTFVVSPKKMSPYYKGSLGDVCQVHFFTRTGKLKLSQIDVFDFSLRLDCSLSFLKFLGCKQYNR